MLLSCFRLRNQSLQIEIHCEELQANWQLAVNGEEVFKIEPLK